MVQTILATEISLYELRTKFNLSQTEDEQFFREWQDSLSELSEAELRSLDRVKSNYRNLIEHPPLVENAV